MKTWYSLLVGLFLSSSIALPVKAQITTDGTTNTTLTNIDTGIRIDGGNRAEGNLFHSFEQFSVLNGSEAFFNNANDIVNIFSRVTGGNISTIDGLLRANGTANLFLLNPAGIIFGENAQLDIGGSFLSSTADSIVFSDGEFLATDADEPPLLTINMPIGLNLGNNPGQIVNRSYNGNGLEVATGESITLIGGNINLEGGRLFAPEGRVELGGLSAAGEIGINADGSLSFPEGVARADVTLTNGARVDASTFGDENGGGIQITGDSVTIQNESLITTQTLGEGNGGNIEIDANQFKLENSLINASTLSTGSGGTVTIDAAESVEVIGFGFSRLQETLLDPALLSPDSVPDLIRNLDASFLQGILALTGGRGEAGGIEINTQRLSILDGSLIATATLDQGSAGAVVLNTSNLLEINGSIVSTSTIGIDENKSGNAGSIEINTGQLSISEGGQVVASTLGSGKGGELIVNATDLVELRGRFNQDNPSSLIVGSQQPASTGDGGNLKIFTPQLIVRDGAQINASSIGKGNAGDFFIQANSIALENGASLFASTLVGTGGNITLEIAESLTLRDDSFISAEALGDANGGNIDINSGFVLTFPSQNEGNDIIANAQQGQGGNINITAQGIFGLEEGTATDNDGNRLRNGTNELDASSRLGTNGRITINELETNPAEGIEDIPRFVIDPDKLVVFSLCSLARDSEFYVTGQGGNAPNLAEIRDEGVIAVDLVEPVPLEEEERRSRGAEEQRSRGAGEEIVEAQGWIFHENGVVELVAYKTAPNGAPSQPKDPRVCPK